MTLTRRASLRLLCAAPASVACAAPPDFSQYSDAQKEDLLLRGKIDSFAEIGHGVTKPVKASLSLNGITHSAQIQVVDKELPDFFPPQGNPVPSKDSWRFNVAAYRIDRLLGLRMVAVVVARPFRGKPGAFSWWVDDVQFEEVERIKREITPPNPEDFDRQIALTRVFDELIINIDRNLANLLITNSWRVALIDHTRSFNPYPGIRNTEKLTRCSRSLLAGMQALSSASVAKAVGAHLTPAEIRGLLGRRDRIVEFFAKAAKEKGEDKVFF
ncbi:MAG: hypothetical protein HY821_03630 [Acidobacteria bacterium]|nr:hypothetical protein [Acidobacteriota bacterium]